jgi:LuxR family transcriptional regulator, maltose regulon positive regulatory protein
VDPDRFWMYAIEALIRAGLPVRQSYQPRMSETIGPSFLALLVEDILDSTDPVVLTLDDADGLPQAVTMGLDFLVRHAAPRFRVICTGRAIPQLPLHRYRLSEDLAVVGSQELAFTATEVQHLITAAGISAPPEFGSALRQLTEGWPTATALAVSRLTEGVDAHRVLESARQVDGDLGAYLAAEVFQRQPAEVREFVLRLSVAEYLDANVAEYLTGRSDSKVLLDALTEANSFVDAAEHEWATHRVHGVYRRFLQTKLREQVPADFAALQDRYTRWLVESGHGRAAVELLAKSGRGPDVAESLIECYAVGPILYGGGSGWPRVDIDDTEQTSAAASLIRAAQMHAMGQPLSARIQEVVDGLADDELGPTPLAVSAAVLRAAISSGSGRAQADRAIALMSASPATQQSEHPEMWAVVLAARAAAISRTAADPRRAVRAYSAALSACEVAGPGALHRQCFAWLALLQAAAGSLRHADTLARTAEQLCDAAEIAKTDRSPAASLALAWTGYERFNQVDARRRLSRAQLSTPDTDPSLLSLVTALLSSRLLRSKHDVTGPDRLLEALAGAPSCPPWLRQRMMLDIANLYLEQEDVQHATEVLRRLPLPQAPDATLLNNRLARHAVHGAVSVTFDDPAFEIAPPVDILVEMWIDKAISHLERGDTPGAARAVRIALGLAEPQDLRRPFLDSGILLRRFIRSETALIEAAEWLSTSRPNTTGESQAAHPVDRMTVSAVQAPPRRNGVDLLSDRELEVLRHLANLQTTEEIAAALFVSVNTVRSHVRSILRKLDVNRRHEAVRRGRELSLV